MPIQVKPSIKLHILSKQNKICKETGLEKISHPSDSHISDSASTVDYEKRMVKPPQIIDSTSNRKAGSTQPVWSVWKKRTCIKLWELVALSININPSQINKIKESDPIEYGRYRSHLKTAISWLNIELLIVDHPSNGTMSKNKMVSPLNFVRCAKTKGIKVAKNLLIITKENIDSDSPAIQEEVESPFDPLPISGIAKIFALVSNSETNIEQWNEYARQAKRNGLANCRKTKGVGRGKSTFDPMEIGEWLVLKGSMSQEKVNKCLAMNLPARSEHLKELIAQ